MQVGTTMDQHMGYSLSVRGVNPWMAHAEYLGVPLMCCGVVSVQGIELTSRRLLAGNVALMIHVILFGAECINSVPTVLTALSRPFCGCCALQ